MRQDARRAVVLALGLNFVWINASEIFRYFVFVMPMMRGAFPEIADVAPMSVPIFLIWGVWCTLLVVVATAVPWLVFDRFGATLGLAIAAGTFVWSSVFVMLWLGVWNMNLATIPVLAVALPLAWLEMVVAALLV